MYERYISAWEPCPLDVETLAKYSVLSASRAAQQLADMRGVECEFSISLPQIPFAFSSLERLKIDGKTAEAWSSFSGFFKTSDGWVRTHGNYPHHAAAIRDCFGVENREELVKTLLSVSRFDVEESLMRHGGIAVAVRTRHEWAQHPQELATAHAPWVSLDVEPQNVGPQFTNKPNKPAEGIRVLDLTRVIAGPTCSQIFACLGADVLRVDPPFIPELKRQFISNAQGKRSAVIDLSRDKDALHQLLTEAQVVILGYSPGSLDKFGLSIENLRDTYPHLLIASLSAWGDEGPWSTQAGFDSIVQAATGISEICNYSREDGERVPGALPVQALDHSTGFLLAKHILDCLAQEKRGVINASLLGAARELMRLKRKDFSYHGQASEVVSENVSVVNSPYGVISVPSIPITVDGVFLTGNIGRYGDDALSWLDGQ